jgi:hypothetical protein
MPNKEENFVECQIRNLILSQCEIRNFLEEITDPKANLFMSKEDT